MTFCTDTAVVLPEHASGLWVAALHWCRWVLFHQQFVGVKFISVIYSSKHCNDVNNSIYLIALRCNQRHMYILTILNFHIFSIISCEIEMYNFVFNWLLLLSKKVSFRFKHKTAQKNGEKFPKELKKQTTLIPCIHQCSLF